MAERDNEAKPARGPSHGSCQDCVTISGKAATQGEDLNGFIAQPQSFSIGSQTAKVAFDDKNKRIGRMLPVYYVTDQTSMITVLAQQIRRTEQP